MRYFLTVLLLFVALPVLSYATPSKVVVLTENYAPFNFEQEGKLTGISTTIVQAILEESGLDYEIKLLPWKRAVNETQTTPNTLIFTIARTEKREDKYYWLGKLFDRRVSLFRLSEREELAGKGLEEVRKSHTVCVVDGGASVSLLQSLGFSEENLTKMTDTQYTQCSQFVRAGRADFLTYNPYAMRYKMRAGLFPAVFEEQLLLTQEDGYYVAANLDTAPEFLEKLEQAYEQVQQSGLIQRIVDEYFSEP